MGKREASVERIRFKCGVSSVLIFCVLMAIRVGKQKNEVAFYGTAKVRAKTHRKSRRLDGCEEQDE